MDTHGCLACPHPGVGPAILGSPDVNVNGRPALRVDDPGIHAACCAANTWTASKGCETVFINNKAAFRMTDPTRHCGGQGRLVEGSPNVIVGDATGGGGGGAGSGRMAAGARGSGAASGAGAAGAASGATGGEASGGGGGGGGGGGSSGAAGGGGGASSGAPGAAGPGAAPPGAPPPEPPPDPTFVEIVLIGEDRRAVPGERYLLTTPDGTIHSGVLGDSGRIKVWTPVAGDCTVEFPDLDRDAWEEADG